MIGVFDSGVGGLSVLGEIRRQIPEADLLYVADRARAPYGPRPLDQVREIAREVTRWLLNQGCDTIVVACNTASAASLDILRTDHPSVPIVGMEPALKPAATSSQSGVVGVFATAATFQGRLFEALMENYAADVEVLKVVSPEWVELVESGQIASEAASKAVAQRLAGPLEMGCDTFVLGCTHFSFLAPLIHRLTGQDKMVIDPAPAVAAQTRRVASDVHGSGQLRMAASGDLSEFETLAATLAKLDTVSPALPFPT